MLGFMSGQTETPAVHPFTLPVPEAELNAHGQATTRVDGLDLHFLHVRSPRPDARPLIITHGWPRSVVEPLPVAGALADPGDDARPAFHVG